MIHVYLTQNKISIHTWSWSKTLRRKCKRKYCYPWCCSHSKESEHTSLKIWFKCEDWPPHTHNLECMKGLFDHIVRFLERAGQFYWKQFEKVGKGQRWPHCTDNFMLFLRKGIVCPLVFNNPIIRNTCLSRKKKCSTDLYIICLFLGIYVK